MEKSREEKQNQFSKAKYSSSSGKSNLWDCGSTLYDSFELNSFKRQLDLAIANSSRALSMPHLPERRLIPLQPPPPPPLPRAQPSSSAMSNKSFKISRPFQKFLRFVFKSSNKSTISSTSSSNTTSFQLPDKYSKDRFYVVYDKSEPVLSTIPELPEFEIAGLLPEISSLVRRSASERFTATAIGVSCA